MEHEGEKTTRLKKLQKILSDMEADAALLILSRDIFYYSGTAQPCILIVTPTHYFLMVRRAIDFVLKETWLDTENIVETGSFQEAANKLKELGVKKGRLGLELDVIPVTLFAKIMNTFHEFQPVNVSAAIMEQRMQKDQEEITLIRNACKIMEAGHRQILKVLSAGMTELELAAEVEWAQRQAGHEGIISMRNFDFYISRGPLCSGENLFKVSGFSNTVTGVGLSPAVPAGPSRRKIRKGDLIIVDIPTCYQGYHCDETRTYLLGTPSREVRELFQSLQEISDDIIACLKEGVKCREVFDVAYSSACRLGVEEYFLGLEPRKGNFVGHGIGLDANEPPVLFAKSEFILKDGMVVTAEIHLTHPEHGVVKLEDVILIKENSCERLSVTERELFVV